MRSYTSFISDSPSYSSRPPSWPVRIGGCIRTPVVLWAVRPHRDAVISDDADPCVPRRGTLSDVSDANNRYPLPWVEAVTARHRASGKVPHLRAPEPLQSYTVSQRATFLHESSLSGARTTVHSVRDAHAGSDACPSRGGCPSGETGGEPAPNRHCHDRGRFARFGQPLRESEVLAERPGAADRGVRRRDRAAGAELLERRTRRMDRGGMKRPVYVAVLAALAVVCAAPAPVQATHSSCAPVEVRDGGELVRFALTRSTQRLECRYARRVVRRFFAAVARGECRSNACSEASPRGWECGLTANGIRARTSRVASCERRGRKVTVWEFVP